ncbi:MAG: class A beta-lactamase, subclass A2 [Bacteroidetes bacterium]|nr:class A beta-lactamase, subclass A2 [Bacteroidota bacterium]
MRLYNNYILQILFVTFVFPAITFSQLDSQRKNIKNIINNTNGSVGTAIFNLENGDTLTFNGEAHFPMQSVYKFPLALAVLNEIDKGAFSLEQKIYISKNDLLPNTWSPLRDKYPNGNVDIAISELLTYTVSQSDNNGCDILFRLIGGPAKVNEYVHSLGIEGINIVSTEEEMHKDGTLQYKNWTTPKAMGQLLIKFVKESIISTKSKDFLWDVMASTVTGKGRIKGLLPEGTIVAHKTGSSGMDENGLAAATNDVGIIKLPGGGDLVVVVLVSDCKDDEKTRDKIIADIARLAWESSSNQKKILGK